jgi:ribosome-binding factor A
MPREYGRNRRVADLVQRELAVLIQRELEPGRAGIVTVSNTDVSPDLSLARIHFTSLGGTLDSKELAAELNSRAGSFRRQLAQSLSLRNVPRLKFLFDESVERAARLSSLIEKVKSEK